MKRELQRKYLPAHYRQEVFLRLHGLQQRELTVEAYTSEFEQLMLKSDLTEPEEHTVARFLGGLRPNIGNVVQLQPFWTLADVQSLAFKVEKQLRTSGRPYMQSRSLPPPPPVAAAPVPTPPAARTVSQDVRATDSRKTETATAPSLPPARRCFRCQGFGHIASTCPTRNLLTFSEQGEVFERAEEIPEAETVAVPEETEEVCHLQADEGELLMTRRVLTVGASHGEDWRRRNIFHTKCTIQGRICSLIIDSGSCENVASANMVRKLNLRTERHPCPYALSWLNQKNALPVTKKCLVGFSMSTALQEQVWCDVVPMDVCHLLLGRPWQYDRRTEHDGERNTYSFRKENRRFTLMPLMEDHDDSGLLIQKSPLPPPTRYSTGRLTPLIGFSTDEVEASQPGENDAGARSPDPDYCSPEEAGPLQTSPVPRGPHFDDERDPHGPA